MKRAATIIRGGTDPERLYLSGLKFKMPDGTRVSVKRTNHPNSDMKDHIARHRGRYALVGLYSRPGFRVLDFPCGSGYASEMLAPFKVSYEGKESDPVTVEYARRTYKKYSAKFSLGDLTAPTLPALTYEVIACIEGLEHIEKQYQAPLIKSFFKALKPEGVLIISSPENPTGISGPSTHNPYHKHELNRADFLSLLSEQFGAENVELITHKATLSSGVLTTCFYGVCHKPS